MASTQFATTTHYVVPTRNDVAPTNYEGYGRVLQELTFVPGLHALGGMKSWVVDGFELPGTGAGITSKTITAGEAIIDGYRVATHSTAFSVDFYDDKTNYVYLRLLYNLSKVVEVVVEVHDTAPSSQPANSVFLGEVVTASTAISVVRDFRPSNHQASGYYTGDGQNSHTVTIPEMGDVRPTVVLLYKGAATYLGGIIMRQFSPADGEKTFFFELAAAGVGILDNNGNYPYAVGGGLHTSDNSNWNDNAVHYGYYVLQ